jgi:hypothetical protein
MKNMFPLEKWQIEVRRKIAAEPDITIDELEHYLVCDLGHIKIDVVKGNQLSANTTDRRNESKHPNLTRRVTVATLLENSIFCIGDVDANGWDTSLTTDGENGKHFHLGEWKVLRMKPFLNREPRTDLRTTSTRRSSRAEIISDIPNGPRAERRNSDS